MELEEEAQICRLCGQCESIYIDVFGEEGTKRFLGLKIHTKINILIDERDPLPKAICVQCLGKLEFVCDFQEECLRTQHLLRNRYNLPPLTEIVEVKTEDIAPSTSTNNNNNIDKDLNNSNEENIRNIDQRVLRHATKSPRNLRNQQQLLKNTEESPKDQNNSRNSNEQNIENIGATPTSETTPTRWLRSRQTVDTNSTTSNENTVDTPIANRLRSHDNSSSETAVTNPNSRNSNNTNETTTDKQNTKQQDPQTIKIPTSALNKLLTIVSNSQDIDVSVKESRNHSNDTEDISFTVELCKKENDDETTVVRARVFPDQGSCLVDKGIVNLLQNQSCVEVNSIINTIISSSVKNGNSTKVKDPAEFEQKWQASQNPEELFRIDGEEVRVDDNIEHIVTDNQNGYACKLCRKVYERKDKCMVHVKTHLGIKQYTCILCNAKFVCKSDVMKHIRCSHTNPRPIQCPKCPKRFKSKFYLTEHDNVHKGVRPYCCQECGQSYHHKVSLQIHMKLHLPPQNLACEYCGKVFPYRTRLLSHVASVHLKNRRNFRCRFCYNLYSSLSVLNEHIKTRHATTYTCEVCGKTFKVSSKYKAHVLQHSNPKPFVCNICNNRYASKAFLNEHLLKHEGLRKHICQKCGASFAQASHLAAHRHVHGEKKHACPECGRKFNRRDNMKVHRKRHFEEKKTGSKQKTDGATVTTSNEKIEENDGLPQRVCVRCLGTLEFLCDFYERCHLTQKEFSEAQNEKINETKADFTEESDADSDKENALPPPNNMKRKVKISSSDNTKAIKSCLNENNVHQSETNNHKNSSNIEPAMQTTLQLSNHLTNKESMVDIIVPEKKEEDKNLHVVKHENHAPKKEYASKKILRRSIRSLNNSINKEKSRKSESNISTTTLEKSLRRKRGRISLNRSTVKRAIKKSLDNKKSEEPTTTHSGQPMRHCLRTICINKSNALDTVALKLKMQSLSVEPKIRMNEHDSTTNNCLSTESSTKSKAVSVIVKQEKTEIEDSLSQQAINFPWAPSEMLIQNPENPQKDNVVTHMSPPPGDEAERDKTCDSDSTIDNKTLNHSDVPDSAEMDDLRPVSFQNRITVIKSSQTGEIIVPDILAHTDLSNIESTMDQSTRDSLGSDFAERSFSRRSSRNNSFSENKSKDVRFGKISELISDEQKETIETYYKVDMSVVNSDEVTKHITIIDKKNIKCNICGTLYPRIDKCQVHIWGHLEIKPYQCKACDFATVTVSNVRCHIRKSHLKIKPFACYLCEKKYVTSVLLEEHLNTHTGARPFKCGICDFASASRQMLSYHNTTHRSTKDFNCKVCSRQFYSRSRLRAHMRIHNKDKVVMCKLCSAYLSNVEALETHHKNIHMQDYICNVCGKRVKSKKALYNHRNVHAAAKYKCPKCPNIYKSRQILKDHLLKHEGIRKYKCDVCEKSFAQQSHLAAHMAVHSKIRFHCPGCERAFNRHDNMKMHTKRCKLFLANPDLQNLITRKERSKSMNKVKQLDTNCTATDTYKSIRPVESQTEVVIDTEKTDANLCKLGLNISCIGPRSESWDHDVQNAAEIMNSVEADMIHITRIDNDVIPENGNLTVRENILGPEHF